MSTTSLHCAYWALWANPSILRPGSGYVIRLFFLFVFHFQYCFVCEIGYLSCVNGSFFFGLGRRCGLVSCLHFHRRMLYSDCTTNSEFRFLFQCVSLVQHTRRPWQVHGSGHLLANRDRRAHRHQLPWYVCLLYWKRFLL